MCARAGDEQASQRAISLFGDRPAAVLAAGAAAAAGEPDPRRKIARPAKHTRIGHLGNGRARGDRADAGDLHQPTSCLIATSRADDRSLECTHVGIECLPLSHQQQQRATRHLRDRCFRRSLELLDQRAQTVNPLLRHDPKLAQRRPQRVRRHRALAN